MAIGDAAAAAGYEVVPAGQDLREGYLRINTKGDELAALKAQVAALTTAAMGLVPVGTSIQGYWQTAPTGFIFEEGQMLLKTGTYAALYAAIGDIHNNPANPAPTGYFRVPDSRGRVQAAKSIPAFGAPDFNFLGGLPGQYEVSLTAAQNGTHTHGVNSVVAGLDGYGTTTAAGSAGRGITGGTTTTSDASGSGAPHLNVQPTIIVNRALKY